MINTYCDTPCYVRARTPDSYYVYSRELRGIIGVVVRQSASQWIALVRDSQRAWAESPAGTHPTRKAAVMDCWRTQQGYAPALA